MEQIKSRAATLSGERKGAADNRSGWLSIGITVVLLLLVSQVQAHTATRFFDVEIVELAEQGYAENIQGILLLRNQFKEEAFLVSLRHSERYDVRDQKSRQVTGKRLKIAPGDVMKVPFRFSLGSDGKYRVILQLDVFNLSGSIQLGHQPVDLYFKVDQGKYQRSSYQDLYLPKVMERPKEGPPAVFGKTMKTPMDAPVVPLPKGVGAVLGEKRLQPHALPEPQGTGGELPDPKQKLDVKPRKPLSSGSLTKPEVGDRLASKAPVQPKTWWSPLLDALPISQAHAFGPGPSDTYTVSGRFSYRGLDNNLHPGWNWFVQLWWKKSNGSWEKLASRYIPPSGNWSLSFSKSGYSGQHLLIQYRAGSYFIMPQDQNNNEYWWGDPEQTNIPTNFDIGHRVADTSSGGTVAGLGDVHNSAYLYWDKFTRNGVNPERSEAIRLFFPNTWDNCGGTSPWSCASVGGDIWLIAAHTDDYTIQHELAHQTNNEYWNNERPPGAGGAHTITVCYNDGLALREGFANAVPHWVLDGEHSADPTAGGFELESPSTTDVCNGDTNELWVAGVFWDLLDRHSDGQDVLYFNNAVEVFSIYLNAGVKDGIKNYRSDYRNAASSGHEGYIDDIYENNTIPVP